MSGNSSEYKKIVIRFPVKFWTRHRVSHEWTTSAQVIYYLHIVPVAGNGKDVLNGGSYLGKTFQSLMWTLVEVNLFILNNHLSVFQTKKKSWLCCIISWKYVSLGIAYQGLWGEQILEYQKDTMWNQTLSEAFLLMCRRWQFSHPERGIIRN